MIAPRQVLTAVEFEVLWACLGLGPTPVTLRLASPGRTDVALPPGWDALRARGLAGPGGPDPELARLLHLLAAPPALLELRGDWGRPVRAIAAGGGDAGVLALRQDATVVLAPCAGLATAITGMLPRAGAARGRARIAGLVAGAAGVLHRLPGGLTIDDGPGGRMLVCEGTRTPVDAGTLRRLLAALLS